MKTTKINLEQEFNGIIADVTYTVEHEKEKITEEVHGANLTWFEVSTFEIKDYEIHGLNIADKCFFASQLIQSEEQIKDELIEILNEV